jgi:hypothetical protein
MRLKLLLLLSIGLSASCSSASSDSAAPQGPAATTPPNASPQSAPPAPVVAQADYLVIAADSLAASAHRFESYRNGTGHKVAFVLASEIAGGTTDATAVVAKIHDRVKLQFDARDPSKPFFVLIVGDAVEDAPFDSAHVPAGSYTEPSDGSKITTDNLYADMDGDNIPDLAVGRIAASSDADVDTVLDKTKKSESTYEVGEWNRRLNLFASTSGFGEPIDTQIEQLVFAIVEDLPYQYDITLTYAKQSSPYVYVPQKFSDKVYERLNEGSLMMAYVGHGDTDAFATLDWSGASFPILDTSELSKIDALHKPPLLTLIACLTGSFATGDSLSEQILRTKNGPMAILSSTEVSHPYANAIFIRELGQALTNGHDATAGELFVDAKRRMIQNDDALRKEIDSQVDLLVGADQRTALKRSHLYMYTLFGDPAARLQYPRAQANVTAANAAPGADASISAKFTGLAAGQARVTLETKRTIIGKKIDPVPADDDPKRDEVIAANYAAANDRVVVEKTVAHDGTTFTTTLTIPADAIAGDYVIKVYADDGTQDAFGSAAIKVGP